MMGIVAGLIQWKIKNEQRIKFYNELARLYEKAEFYLVNQNVKTVNFFEDYRGTEEVINTQIARLSEMLKNHRVKTGIAGWNMVMENACKSLDIDDEIKAIIENSGESFFEKNKNQISQKLRDYKKIILKISNEQKEKYKANEKVLYPVGVLCGLMLVIILI